MWGGLYWAKNFFAGLYWGPISGSTPPVVVPPPSGGWVPPKKGKKPRNQKAPWERSAKDVRASLMEVVRASQERQDEEDLLAFLLMMGFE